MRGRIGKIAAEEGRDYPKPVKSARALAREAAEEAKANAIAEQEREESAVAALENNGGKRQKVSQAAAEGGCGGVPQEGGGNLEANENTVAAAN